MLHLRIIVPPDRTAAVQELLTGNDAVTHVVVLPGVAVEPVGELQLVINVAAIIAAGVLTLCVQRLTGRRRRTEHSGRQQPRPASR